MGRKRAPANGAESTVPTATAAAAPISAAPKSVAARIGASKRRSNAVPSLVSIGAVACITILVTAIVWRWTDSSPAVPPVPPSQSTAAPAQPDIIQLNANEPRARPAAAIPDDPNDEMLRKWRSGRVKRPKKRVARRPVWLPADPSKSCPHGPIVADQIAFKTAVLAGDYSAVVSLLTRARNCSLQILQSRDNERPHRAAIHWALTARHAQNDNRTLHSLIGSHERIIQLLLTTPGAVEIGHMCPLYFAAACRNSIAVSLLLTHSPAEETTKCMAWFRDWNDESILHTAARLKGSGFARFFLQPPKHASVLLLNDFSRPNCTRDAIDRDDTTSAVLTATAGGGYDLAEYQRRMRCSSIAFTELVKAAGARDIRHLIESDPLSIDPNHRNRIGDTALHVAAAGGRTAAVHALLLATQIDTGIVNDAGMTALHAAAAYGWPEIAELLVTQNRTLCDLRDRAGRTAYDLARLKHNSAVADVLTDCTTDTTRVVPPPARVVTLPIRSNRKFDSGDWTTASPVPAAAAVSPHSSRCDIDIVNGESLALDDLLLHYISIGRPVLIRYPNRPPKWNAFRAWKRAPFLKRFGSHQFPVTAIPFFYATELSDADRKRITENRTATASAAVSSTPAQRGRLSADGRLKMKLSEFVSLHMPVTSTSPGVNAVPPAPTVNDTSAGDAEPTPYIFSSADLPAELWADIALPPPLDRIEQPPSAGGGSIPVEVRQFGIGPAGSGSPPHFHLPAFNMLVFGRKEWYMWPPQHAYFSTRHIARELSRMRADPHHLACVQEAGDVMFVPHHYGHAVYNVEPSLCAAFEMFA